jgi:hypothetical protein
MVVEPQNRLLASRDNIPKTAAAVQVRYVRFLDRYMHASIWACRDLLFLLSRALSEASS